jgi:hypothetical protein
MDADCLFSFADMLVLTGWLILIFLPRGKSRLRRKPAQ